MRDGAAHGRDRHVHIGDQTGHDLQADDAVLRGRVEEARHVVDNGLVRLAIVPAKLGHAAQQGGQLLADEVLELGALVGEVVEDVVAQLNAFVDADLGPERGDELVEAEGGKLLRVRDLCGCEKQQKIN